MKTTALILTALLGAGIMLTSCQKDNSLASDNMFSQSLDQQNPADKTDPGAGDLGSTVDLIFNYPDPFSEKTTIQFRVLKAERVSLVVNNEYGDMVAEIVTQFLPEGEYRYEFDAKDLPVGPYRARLQVGDTNIFEDMTKIHSVVDH